MSVRSLVAVLSGTVFVSLWAPHFAAAAPIAMGSTGCSYYEDEAGKQGSKVTGVQCAFTSSLDGTQTDNNPIPLVTGGGLLGELNTWLSSNGKGVSIQQSSFVGIEALGGRGRNGDSCGTFCGSGGGAGGGYAVSVQTLGGMQQLIAAHGGYVDQDTPPLLFVFVGRDGIQADHLKGGGGGAASFVTGVHPAQAITESEVLFPSAQTNAGQNPDGTDDLFFVIAGGGGGGGGARNGSGDHGGAGGRMNDSGPIIAGDHTASGEHGNGNHGGKGGSSAGDGIGGDGSTGNHGATGVGGEGGMGAGFIGSTFAWPYGLGGPIGGDEGVGGAGGGGWGGGGGGGESDGAGHGGGGGGSWARQSVSTAISLPMLFNLLGADFSLSDAGFSQVVLSFSVVENEVDDPTAVPEPSSLAMLLAGLAVAVGRARRKVFASAEEWHRRR